MKQSKRLKPIVELADSKEKAAIEELGRCQKQRNAEVAKLDQLKSFQEQYSNRLSVDAGKGITATHLVDYRMFLEKLTSAIREQEHLIGQIDEQLGMRKKTWESARRYKQGMSNLLDTSRQKEIRIQLKREQGESDDRASRNFGLQNGIKSA